MNINRVVIAGRLGQQPEVKVLDTGVSLCHISVATNEHWKNKSGEKQEKTSWHKVTLWGKQAEFAGSFLNRGDAVLIEGKIQYSDWLDDNKTKRQSVEIVASKIDSLTPKKQQEEAFITTNEIPF